MAQLMNGIIIEEHKSIYLVDTADGLVGCTLKGVARKSSSLKPCAGDSVSIEITKSIPAEGYIASVAPRRNQLKRPLIANIDQALYVFSLKEPSVDLEVMDRFLFLAKALDINAILVLNKIDLLDDTDITRKDRILTWYHSMAYPIIEVSAASHKNIDLIIRACLGKITCIAGSSGVGKTTVLNAIFPDLDLPTQELSIRSARGKQTTSSTMLLRLKEGGYIADTPGFTVLNLPYVLPEDVQLYFPEMERCVGKCKFNNCLHENEPGCVVKELVEKGEIGTPRYTHYLNILGEMRSHKDKYEE
jgi:ribosome biogenesis GTPase / thiamine phosphate phosphatase